MTERSVDIQHRPGLDEVFNSHSTALVPIETWAYQSPTLRRRGQALDIGLLAESLIYYDRVLVIPASEATFAHVLPSAAPPPTSKEWVPDPLPPFSEFVKWFVDRDLLNELMALLRDGTLSIYYYAFRALPILKDGSYILINVQEEGDQTDPSFMRRVAMDRSMDRVIEKPRKREQLYRVLENRVREVKASQFAAAVENAHHDFATTEMSSFLVEAFVDEVRPLLNLLHVPEKITATITARNDRTTHTFNIRFSDIDSSLGPRLRFTEATPLVGIVQTNRTMWSAALENCDLYLPSPLSAVAAVKMIQGNERRLKTSEMIEMLQREVEFPDVRTLVNSGALSFHDVLAIRKKARQFRQWLQAQSDRDTNALLAYHHDVAKEAGFTRNVKKALNVFGMLSGAAAGVYATASITPEHAGTGAVVGAAVGGKAVEEGVRYVLQLAGKLDAEWRPIAFGQWASKFVGRVSTQGTRRL